jgi:hypothetical protein
MFQENRELHHQAVRMQKDKSRASYHLEKLKALLTAEPTKDSAGTCTYAPEGKRFL